MPFHVKLDTYRRMLDGFETKVNNLQITANSREFITQLP